MGRILFVVLLFSSSIVSAQQGKMREILGAGIQVHTYGFIPGFTWEHLFRNQHSLRVNAGLNITNRHSAGKQQQEWGMGEMLGVGYRRFFNEATNGFFAGITVDGEHLRINWIGGFGRRGWTDVVVVQPTAELGYRFMLDKRWLLDIYTSHGAEINVATDGPEVGQGYIGMLGFRFNFLY